jgi:hypothetical protein
MKRTLLLAIWAAPWLDSPSVSPRVIDHKLSVRGIGAVLEQPVKGGTERAQPVSVRRGP